MAHLLLLAGLFVAAWIVLALPLGVAIGRCLRASRRATQTRTTRSSR